MRRICVVCLAMGTAMLLTSPESVAAYVGPGAGLTVIGAALAFIGSIFLGIVGFIWYPMKRIFRAGAKKDHSVRPTGK